ncbi:hypothetical protein ACH5RR_000887 [Cinchona calisaya]|uniref:Uncharacterized protein n=1 Tax=Cinchona calisaya TaxID=153742 RepID=A0ABD3B270_9GENT
MLNSGVLHGQQGLYRPWYFLTTFVHYVKVKQNSSKSSTLTLYLNHNLHRFFIQEINQFLPYLHSFLFCFGALSNLCLFASLFSFLWCRNLCILAPIKGKRL